MKYLLYLPFCSLLFLCTATFSQNSQFIVYDSTNSPFDTTRIVTCIAIDTNGNIWFGFWDEDENADLVIFDGIEWKYLDISTLGLERYIAEMIVFDESNNLWISLYNEGVAMFDGTEWTLYNTSNSDLPLNHVYCINFDEDNNIWMGTWDNLVKYDGNDWTIFDNSNSNFPDDGPRSIKFDLEGNKWMSTWNGLVKMSKDDSITVYTSQNSDLYNNMVEDIAIDSEDNIWTLHWDSQDDYLRYQKFDGLSNWITFKDSIGVRRSYPPIPFILDNHGNIWPGIGELRAFDGNKWTFYRDIEIGWARSIAVDKFNNKWFYYWELGVVVFNEDEIVSIEEEAKRINLLSENLTLFQNYPNPFNPKTKIQYSIPKQSNTTLKVFDVLGSEVATLVDTEQPKGNYEVEFDSSADGVELTSGIYFYQLNAEEYTETKKMILLK